MPEVKEFYELRKAQVRHRAGFSELSLDKVDKINAKKAAKLAAANK